MNKSELGHCSDNSYDNNSPKILDILINEKIDYIILAGYLLKIPEILIQKYPDKIINIHPALLPKYGGKGMYGDRVHKAVIAANERESGITIHVVNEVYDSGKILFQDKCIIDPSDTPEDLAAKIHVLEQKNFPKVIEKYILSKEQ
jgi:Folate-dependent phosphoribosylglycinamide formyltransferase PurN